MLDLLSQSGETWNGLWLEWRQGAGHRLAGSFLPEIIKSSKPKRLACTNSKRRRSPSRTRNRRMDVITKRTCLSARGNSCGLLVRRQQANRSCPHAIATANLPSGTARSTVSFLAPFTIFSCEAPVTVPCVRLGPLLGDKLRLVLKCE